MIVRVERRALSTRVGVAGGTIFVCEVLLAVVGDEMEVVAFGFSRAVVQPRQFRPHRGPGPQARPIGRREALHLLETERIW